MPYSCIPSRASSFPLQTLPEILVTRLFDLSTHPGPTLSGSLLMAAQDFQFVLLLSLVGIRLAVLLPPVLLYSLRMALFSLVVVLAALRHTCVSSSIFLFDTLCAV